MSNILENDVLLKIVPESEQQIHDQVEQEAWEKVYQARQNRSIMQSEISTIETHGGKVCVIVFVGHIKGIIPIEETDFDQRTQLTDAIGNNIYYKVTGLDRDSEIFVASSKQAIEHLQGLTWDRLRTNLIVDAKIVRVNNRSLRLDIGAINVDLRADEVSYEWIDDMHDRYKPGDTIRVKVIDFNKEEKLLKVSGKQLFKNPWPECTTRFQTGNTYKGKVSGVVEYGVFVNLAEGVDILCRQPKPGIGKVKKGDIVRVRVAKIDVEKNEMSGIIKSKV
ncbi:S1 RNA-binding domain-containing protein [Paenibacillus sp. 276b]|uniref:S1 RNA-binding domain-containing protein n=1 Tax=Paenibacillus sp. 276b TaxID=1566277 RepID=UPI00089430C3|nr:S1 RNA-binding domain-containing protein [Paenibacillus sp. 276b]SEB27700.1 S1 RNA binding domain-containing protein [Paenibacillus sp. 276b]